MREIINILKPTIREFIKDGYTKQQIEYFTKNATKEILEEFDKKPEPKEILQHEICNSEVSFVDPPCDTEISYN